MQKHFIKPNFPFNPAKSKVPYAWIILAVGSIGFLMSLPAQTIGVSAFTDYLIKDFGITRDELSLAYMLGTLLSGFIIGKAGKLYDIYGVRVIIIIASVMLGIVLLFFTRLDDVGGYVMDTFPELSHAVVMIILCTAAFFMLRFFGQGVITLVSRNMVMKWFEKRRGLANGIMGVIIAAGFPMAPLIFDAGISSAGWRETWITTAIFIGLGFSVFALMFFRDNPRQCNCTTDGTDRIIDVKAGKKPAAENDFTRKQAVKTYSFWIFNLAIALGAMIITAFTFHIVSVFESANMGRDTAMSVFFPAAAISFVINFGGSWLSDFIKLKYLLIAELAGLILAMTALMLLDTTGITYYLFIIGYGISNGLFGALSAVTWPRFFGVKHLGSIAGFAHGWTVAASALGPFLFSLSFIHTGNYTLSAGICGGIALVLLIMAIKANNINRESHQQ